ncbi:zinc phosphodiesterase ELAC protein 2-like [Pecten maximus]|uniref:zinc phosphodiesterase ELAC protein 2-like n=1 Tax=Pecten maximus TaxID=6579 RepID=UPI001457F3B6|nr:zinc phosphodiesterase ELAC protein 2-like [Pecten maximus]
MLHHVRVLFRRLSSHTRTEWVRDFSATNLRVSVISSGGLGTPKSIVVKVKIQDRKDKHSIDDVHKDDHQYKRHIWKSYLFNCGEGTKRMYATNKFTKNAIEDIFITVTNWENLGGLKGLFTERPKYEVVEGGIFRKELKLYGPESMLDRFYVGRAPVYSLVNATMDMFHEDDYVQIKFVPFFPDLSEEDLEQFPVDVRNETKNWRIEGIQPKVKRKMSSIVYILKAREENNTLPTIMVLECPDKRYLESLLASEDLKKYQSVHGTHVFHLSPVSVVQDPRYKTFIDRFHSSTEHIHVDETQGQPSQNSVRYIQSVLNELDDNIFPVLPSSANLLQNMTYDKVLRYKKNKKKLLSTRCGQTIEFEDHSVRLDHTLRPIDVSLRRGIQKLKEADEKYLGSVKEFVQKQNRNKVEYPVILFLGTGATLPTTLRNVTGIYLETDPHTAILLDCGEGTFMQMCLHFGGETNEKLRKIKCIFISHLHADHIVGLASILKQRHLAFKEIGVPVEAVDIIGEDDISALTYTLAYFVPNILKETVLHKSRNFRPIGYLSKIHEKLNLTEFRTVKALHNYGRAHSVSIKHQSGWHLVFSGDTMPSDSLINLGLNCDLLIHEATYSSRDVHLAKLTNHSTVAGAVEASKQMKAKNTILTHFKSQALLQEKRLILSQISITIAMDHMKVRLSDLDYTPLFNPFFLELSNYMLKR